MGTTQEDVIPETRELAVTAEPLRKDRMLAFYSRFAYATVNEIRLTWDSNLANGGTAIALHAEFPNGSRITEVMNLSAMITAWGEQVIQEYEREQRAAAEIAAVGIYKED